MEGFNICDFFTSTGEFDWLTSNVTDRQGCTTTCITVNLGQNHTSNSQLIIELTRNVGSFLTNHGIDDQEDFVWLSKLFDFSQFGHKGLVNLQTTGRINQNVVIMISFGLF